MSLNRIGTPKRMRCDPTRTEKARHATQTRRAQQREKSARVFLAFAFQSDVLA
jgi:hypothetical protein